MKDRQSFNKEPHGDIKYPQFCGKMKSEEVDTVFQNTRYTLTLPVINGYCTSKYLEALQQGVLPFIPPFYDEQFNAIPKDCFLRVSSPEDMWNKINYLEQNPGVRVTLVKHFQKLWIEPCIDGEFIKAEINNRLPFFGLKMLV